jgi:hypothetical protein
VSPRVTGGAERPFHARDQGIVDYRFRPAVGGRRRADRHLPQELVPGAPARRAAWRSRDGDPAAPRASLRRGRAKSSSSVLPISRTLLMRWNRPVSGLAPAAHPRWRLPALPPRAEHSLVLKLTQEDLPRPVPTRCASGASCRCQQAAMRSTIGAASPASSRSAGARPGWTGRAKSSRL